VRCEVGLVVGRARLWGVGEEQGVPQYLRHQQQRIVGALGLLWGVVGSALPTGVY
jgi:hypothetical protein